MRNLALIAALGMILSLTGCSNSEPRVEVKGKVHKNGQPLRVQELRSGAGGRVMVLFHGLDQGDNHLGPYGAIVKPDGTFSLPGPAGNGIPPGKYRVEITWQDTFPMGEDKLEGKFGKENSPVVVDVGGGEDVDIDVGSFGQRSNCQFGGWGSRLGETSIWRSGEELAKK
jgi:hypothetical protein